KKFALDLPLCPTALIINEMVYYSNQKCQAQNYIENQAYGTDSQNMTKMCKFKILIMNLKGQILFLFHTFLWYLSHSIDYQGNIFLQTFPLKIKLMGQIGLQACLSMSITV
ncbi:MAG: hypothetical protein C0175_01550, partial [Caldisericum exile]